MLLLRAPDSSHVGYFEAVVHGDNFSSYVDALKNTPTRVWESKAKVWRISICDYNILIKNCKDKGLNSIDVDNKLKGILASYRAWEYNTKALIAEDDVELCVDASILKIPMMPHQRVALKFFLERKTAINASEMGCLSGDTEYLSPTGWKKISRYHGGKVCQTTKEGIASFTLPKAYIKRPCKEMFRFHHTRGLDQMLSPEHRVLTFSENDIGTVISAENLARRHDENESGCKARFLGAVSLERKTTIKLSEAQLRLQVACMADGSFPYPRRCRVRLKKQRKIIRIKRLLEDAKIEYHFRLDTDGLSSFEFTPPISTKIFTKGFWKASLAQRQIICDEVRYWDATIRKAGAVTFCAQNKQDADFIQYCFISTGRRARVTVSKDRGYFSTGYIVHAVGNGRSGNYIHIGTAKKNISIQKSPDGFKYCFEVSDTFLLVRRNGCVFVTGNTGKTFPALVAAKHLYDTGQIKSCLVVCIASVKWNWAREVEKCLNGATYKVIEGPQEKRIEGYMSKAHFKIVNYEILRNDIDPILYDTTFDCIIVDEIHRIRTYKAKQTRALYTLGKTATYKYGLTGTPIQNKLNDLFSIMRFVHPSILGNWFAFDRRYVIKGYFGEIADYRRLDEVHDKLKTIMFRRLKSEVLKDLPPKVYNDILIDLSQKQRKFYNDVKNQILESKSEDVEDKINAQAKLLANITFLREVCDSCELIDPLVNASSKLKELKKIVPEILENGHKIVIFSQFKRMIYIIERELKLPAILLTGDVSTTGGARDELIDEFKESKKKNLFLMTTAGGEGINLQCADYVIFFDLPFNPQVMAQVEDRLHRKGQKSTVNVIRLLAKNTIEDRVLDILKFKTKLFKAVVDGKSVNPVVLTQKELLNAIEL